MTVSFVIPARDEAENLPRLLAEVAEAGRGLAAEFEIIVVDDASRDGTPEVLGRLRRDYPQLVALRALRPIGQSGALAAGLARARGDRLVTLDGDLQNDPRDAGRLVAALAEADVACGVRSRRRDGPWRRFTSRVAGSIRDAVLHDGAPDTGCGLKAMRRRALERLVLFDGWHRFLPALARAAGLRVVHLEVSHRPRRSGHSHYGTLDRALRGGLDLAGVWWLVRRRLPGREALAPDGDPPAAGLHTEG